MPRAIKRTFCGWSVAPGRARRAILSFRRTEIPALTTADGEETIPEVPLEFLSFSFNPGSAVGIPSATMDDGRSDPRHVACTGCSVVR